MALTDWLADLKQHFGTGTERRPRRRARGAYDRSHVPAMVQVLEQRRVPCPPPWVGVCICGRRDTTHAHAKPWAWHPALEESHNLGHNYHGAEQLLLGLIREHEGVAAQVLMHLGLNADMVRNEIVRLLAHTD